MKKRIAFALTITLAFLTLTGSATAFAEGKPEMVSVPKPPLEVLCTSIGMIYKKDCPGTTPAAAPTKVARVVEPLTKEESDRRVRTLGMEVRRLKATADKVVAEDKFARDSAKSARLTADIGIAYTTRVRDWAEGELNKLRGAATGLLRRIEALEAVSVWHTEELKSLRDLVERVIAVKIADHEVRIGALEAARNRVVLGVGGIIYIGGPKDISVAVKVPIAQYQLGLEGGRYAMFGGAFIIGKNYAGELGAGIGLPISDMFAVEIGGVGTWFNIGGARNPKSIAAHGGIGLRLQYKNFVMKARATAGAYFKDVAGSPTEASGTLDLIGGGTF